MFNQAVDSVIENIKFEEKIIETQKIHIATSLNKQYEKGKLTAQDRINLLLDKDQKFLEIGGLVKHNCYNFDMQKKLSLGDGVITGCGTINSQNIFIASQDFLVNGGSLGYAHAEKICKLVDLAYNNLCPVLFINDSGGARIQEGVEALAGYGKIFHNNVKSSGVIPQISIIMGPCAGGAVYSPALTDFIFMVKNTSYMYLTGPNVVKKVTYEDVDHETLGGSSIHSSKSGVADFICENDADAILKLKLLLSYLPNNCYETPKKSAILKNKKTNDEYLNHFLPENPNQSYDIKNLINEIVDENSFLEVKKDFAQNIIIGFARLNGHSIGIIANQPLFLAGCLDIDASCKAAKFIRFCDSFNIPIISLIDVPGFLPGTNQEYNGVIIHGAKLLYAYSEATVPKISVVIRKAYGGSYIVMNSKHLGADFNFAWPQSEISVMGVDAAAEVLLKGKADDRDHYEKFTNEYKNLMRPELSGARGFIDDIIQPSDTRETLINSLEIAMNKYNRGVLCFKHKNVPL